MNYFAHAIRYLDRPYFMAGLAVPDWLSVVDRKSRVRSKAIDVARPKLNGEALEIANGIQAHLDDDRWFHGTSGFYIVTGLLGKEFREALPPTDEWRCGFLGHIVMELLLDGVLIEDEPKLIQRYYEVLETVDPNKVQSLVNQLATKEPTRLHELIPLFIKERFLEDYTNDDRLLFRINQVMKRITLEPLPEHVTEVLDFGRKLVREHLEELLPAQHFGPLVFESL